MIYRSKLGITFVHIFILFSTLVIIDDGLDIDYEAFLFATVCILLLTVAVVRYFKITITDGNLRAYDFWGMYHTLEWNSVTSVKAIRILGLKYVRVYGTTCKRPLWIPLFLNDMSGFEKEVCQILDVQHPFRNYLESNSSGLTPNV